MTELEKKLKEKTDEMMRVPAKQSHRRASIFFEMQELYRQIRTTSQTSPDGRK